MADPFMGGGTTLVEALALGREAVGFDISALATFVAEVKTTVYEDRVIAAVDRWRKNVEDKINMRRISVPSWFYETAGITETSILGRDGAFERLSNKR